MSNAEILSLISTISYVLCAVSFVLAVFFWFFFKIPSVIGDLSGRTARKSIEKMRTGNENAAAHSYKPKTSYTQSRQPAAAVPRSPRPVAAPKKKVVVQTEKTVVPGPVPETSMLEENAVATEEIQATELLESGITESLVDEDATVILCDEEETVLLSSGGVALTMLEEVMLIHTDEEIM